MFAFYPLSNKPEVYSEHMIIQINEKHLSPPTLIPDELKGYSKTQAVSVAPVNTLEY